jgi:hypothetical protein
MLGQKQLFDFMLDRVNEVAAESGLKPAQAFGKWFASIYFANPNEFFCSDGSGDGKVDSFFQVTNGKEVQQLGPVVAKSSRLMSFSNSAISARMPITSLPVRDVVSILGSSMTLNSTPLSASLETMR